MLRLGRVAATLSAWQPSLRTTCKPFYSAPFARAAAPMLTSSPYVDAMYNAWRKDPTSVDGSWKSYFEKNGAPSPSAPIPVSSSGSSSASAPLDPKEVIDNIKVESLVRAFVVRGHHVCDLDPLGILNADLDASIPEEVRAKC